MYRPPFEHYNVMPIFLLTRSQGRSSLLTQMQVTLGLEEWCPKYRMDRSEYSPTVRHWKRLRKITRRNFNLQRLQVYNLTSEYHQGRKHNNANALSRLLCQEECTHWQKVGANAAVVAATPRTEQVNDQDVGSTLEELRTGQQPEWKDTTDRSPT
jgi:hypothetical protein